MKIDGTVKKETGFVACGTIVLSLLMEAVFLLLHKWSLAVLWGNLYAGTLAVLNFFLMGLTVQKALEEDPEDAKKRMKASQSYRMLALAILLAVAMYLAVEMGVFNILSLILPLFFVRITVFVRGIMIAKSGQAATYEPIPYDDEQEGGEL